MIGGETVVKKSSPGDQIEVVTRVKDVEVVIVVVVLVEVVVVVVVVVVGFAVLVVLIPDVRCFL